jgi:hypothetical protein
MPPVLTNDLLFLDHLTYKQWWICLPEGRMLSSWNKRHGCAELHATHALHRRSFLQAGLLGAGGLSLAELLRSEARAELGTGREHSVIILWMRGGPSHIDMWDPKPEAPVEYRGEFGSAATSVPGITLTDMLPKSAAIMHKWSIVRSLTHQDAGHSTADQTCFTGYAPGPNPDENVMPSCGSIVAAQLGHGRRDLPSYVMVPRMVPGTGPAYLGVAYKPFETMADPAQPGPFSVPNFAVPDLRAVGHAARFAFRLRQLAARDRHSGRDAGDRSVPATGVGHFEQLGCPRRVRPRPRAGGDA